MRSKLFMIRAADCWKDGWTYGDWRQYVCKRGGETQCARVASLPYILAGLLGVTAACVALDILLDPLMQTNMPSALWLLAALSILPLVVIGIQFSGRTIMWAVGPINRDGRRVLPGEEKEAC